MEDAADEDNEDDNEAVDGEVRRFTLLYVARALGFRSDKMRAIEEVVEIVTIDSED
jgi:hypothetical protein